MAEELGSLSAQFESSRLGSCAIGWDSGGGTSYGRYQIATQTGTMRNFLAFLANNNYPELSAALQPVAATASQKHGPFAAKWLELARAGKTAEAEHHFIKVTHFDPAFNGLMPAMKNAMKSFTLQQVLWSTAVQHGPSGAVQVFAHANGEWPVERIINAVYDARAGRLGHLTPGERSAVLNRYRVERKAALVMSSQESRGASPTGGPNV